MSVSSSAQNKDYRALGSGHAHLGSIRAKNPHSVSGSVKCGSAGSKDGSVSNCENINSLSNNCGGGKHILTAAMKEDSTIGGAVGQKSGPAIGSNGQFETHRHQPHTHPHNNSSKISSSSGSDSVISSNSTALSGRKSYTGSDPSNASFSSASVAGSVQDDNMSDQCSLTQAGLEEYNSRSYYDQPVFHHQKQSSYAQSEGYHSYVSSSDSSSATPFLDRLRQESELLSRQSHHWSQNDLSSSANNVSSTGENNSSESTSSTETLKWLGSMSDVSVASHASSAISGSVSSSSQLIVHSSRVRTPKRHNSESVLYMNEDALGVAGDVSALSSPVSGSKSQPVYPQHPHYHLGPTVGTGLAELQGNSSGTSAAASGPGCPSPMSPSSVDAGASSAMVTTTSSTSSSSSYRSNHRLFPVSTYTEPVNGSNDYQPQIQAQAQPQSHHHHHQFQQPQSAQPQQQQPQHQASVAAQQLPGLKLSSPQPSNWQSVADRINDFERQQQHISVHHYHALQHQAQQSHPSQKYSYIDPSKTHRVPNPALKAFQKNAVQSYFERQQQNAKENSKSYVTSSSSSSNGGMSARPQSLQPPNTPKEVPTPQLRTSLPSNYVMPPANQRSPRAQQIVNNNILESPLSGSEGPFPDCNAPPPPPPPRSRSLMPIRRSSSASDYADFRENFARAKERQSVIKQQQVETVMGQEKTSFNDCGVPPPPPPPRGRTSMPVRRTSSASEFAAVRDKNIQSRQNLSKDLLGPIIMGPIISVDDWVPERPPKNPHLRIPSPDLPPPPLQTPDSDVNLSNQDEPLPPPPPEILRHTRPPPEIEIKPPSPNRRNSFAGSPSRKTFYRASTFDNLSPPSVPKKPSSIEMMHCRPASSLAQSNKAHKVILNGKLECSNGTNGHTGGPIQMQDHLIIPRGNDARMSVRKRAHNSNHPPSPTIEMSKMASKGNIHSVKSPPPLKPRMPIAGQEMRASSVAINSKIRCNSKASYLPRQSRDKLNIADPDHGSYKLTLTSNEDSVNHNASATYHDDILSGKCNNLPDVLPKGAKVQASSPSSSGSSPRYGSNNNINVPTPPHTAPAIIASSYPMKSLFHFQTQNCSSRPNAPPTSNSPPAYSATHRTPQFVGGDPISPKFMSQSTIDLKKTHIIEATETLPSKVLSPAQSESNINCHEKPPLSPFSARRELQRTDVVRKLSLEERDPGEGRIVRAELVNTTLSTSPTRSEEKIMIRKDSLRENIEKITQLQSKLMTSHLVDAGNDRKLLGYTARTVEVKAQQLTIEKEREHDKEKESEKDKDSPPRCEERKSSSPGTKSMSTPPLPSSPPPLLIPSKDELISQMDMEIDGLKLMQRTEIILRLNAPTMEAASQTDETLESELSRVKPIDPKDDVSRNSERSASMVLAPRRKLPEEIDCDNLSKELATCLPPTDKLCQVLAPKIYKLSSDYVSGLYSSNVVARPSLPPPQPPTTKKDAATSMPNDKSIGCELTKAPPVAAAAEEQSYESAPTATEPRHGRETREHMHMNGTESCDLTKKKEELVNRLTKTLQVLGSEQTSIAEDSSANDQLGSDLATKVAEKVRPIDATKFRAYIDDVGHITMLLLSLSGRLAKAENALHTITENHADKKILMMKRDRLLEQLEEAKRLKEDIDRRGTIVGRILEKHLSIDEYADYDYFINMKAKLIVDSREIADRIKLIEEQLSALRDTLVQSEC